MTLHHVVCVHGFLVTNVLIPNLSASFNIKNVRQSNNLVHMASDFALSNQITCYTICDIFNKLQLYFIKGSIEQTWPLWMTVMKLTPNWLCQIKQIGIGTSKCIA